MAAVATAPGLPHAMYELDSHPLSTIRDPRTPDNERHEMAASNPSTTHPDLSSEVATLSNKLISAINHQTYLDDALTAARQELETTHGQVRSLEAENMEHFRQIKSGELVRRDDVDRIVSGFAEDRKRTLAAEQDKKRIEQELENLTTSLFEEANQMVAAARRETEATEQRNHQLRMQVKDTEALLANHQEQLAELKAVMEHMNQARADRDGTTNSTAPSTPALPSHAEMGKAMEAMQMAALASHEDVSPAPPTSYSHLLSPVLRTDLPSYEDFRSLMEIGKRSAPGSRVNSGSYNASAVPGLTSLSTQHPSSASIPGAMPHMSPSGSPYMSPLSVPLKETKFYKRALTEDIEPTLRLDTAPGLSWLVRRSVINSIVEGSLVIEPTPSSTKMFVLPCSLCGEHRRHDEFRRTHRFRTSESDSAQRYPLCNYCLNRMRAACDYISFLRIVKDGHWRTEGAEAEKSAWEESVRLRERMFWARIGGGVVPILTHRDSPRPSTDGSKPNTPYSAPPLLHNGNFEPAGGADKRTVAANHSEANSGDNPANESHGTKLPQAGASQPGGARQQRERQASETSMRGRPPLGPRKASAQSISSNRERSTSRSTSVVPSGAPTPLKQSLAPKLRSRQASYERERINSPDRVLTATRGGSSSSPARHNRADEQGLHISIPGGYAF